MSEILHVCCSRSAIPGTTVSNYIAIRWLNVRYGTLYGRQDGQTAGGVKVGFSRRRQSSGVQGSRPEPTPKSCGRHQAPQRGKAGRTGKPPLTAGEVELGLTRQDVIAQAAVHAGSEVMGHRV